ncbi:hypothetical protein EAI89_19950 [Eubacterium sp. am_0171]|uniref:Uncharacterized protein n=1 Tax=Faecalicatena contorta TaxID=39482 RepID=A0A174D975_9FIRM|nr:hypothetical protein EAI89_19950 [Eubacterium sp. am_0171]CUO22114.1 Uncharacterised protein [[Eubacterium] contortum] [Faecalicatena contorta]
MCFQCNYSRFCKFILLPSINGAFLFHQTNQYAVPLTEPLLVDELNCRLDAPSEMKGLPQAAQMHICR